MTEKREDSAIIDIKKNQDSMLRQQETITNLLVILERRLADIEDQISETVKQSASDIKSGFQEFSSTIEKASSLIFKLPLTILILSVDSLFFWYGKIDTKAWSIIMFVAISPFYGEGLRMLSDFFTKLRGK